MTYLVETHNTRTGYRPNSIRLLVAEYLRAVAAEDYYGGLKRMSTTDLSRKGIARSDIPRRVFDEFYSTTSRGRTAADCDANPRNSTRM